MTEEEKADASRAIYEAVRHLKHVPTKTTRHMDAEERRAVVTQMLVDLYTLAVTDGCVAAGWAYEFALSVADNLHAEGMFRLTESQGEKLSAWVRAQEESVAARQGRADGPCYGAIGGGYTYSFTPTALGVAVVVKYAVTRVCHNLTDYESC